MKNSTISYWLTESTYSFSSWEHNFNLRIGYKKTIRAMGTTFAFTRKKIVSLFGTISIWYFGFDFSFLSASSSYLDIRNIQSKSMLQICCNNGPTKSKENVCPLPWIKIWTSASFVLYARFDCRRFASILEHRRKASLLYWASRKLQRKQNMFRLNKMCFLLR